MASNISGIVVVDRRCYKKQSNFLNRYSKSVCCDGSNHNRSQKNQLKPCRKGHMFRILPFSSANYYRCINKTPYPFYCKGEYIISCHSTNICNREDEMCSRKECCSNVSSGSCHTEDQKDEGRGAQIRPRRIYHPNQGMAEACKYICNDAKFVNERARNDIISLSRGLMRLNIRARRDVAFLGIGFLKLDVRAREDTEKIDTHMREKTARLRHIATIIKDKAQSNLKNAADLHWSDGALEADLKRADFVARRRAMEDAFMALKFVKNFHDMLATKVYQKPQKESTFSINNMMGIITFEKNGETFNPFSGEEAYRNMASALSEADSIDYNDPEELELLVATLIDLDAMDSKRSLSLLAECSRSPDVSTRKALANALASAPSMWILGNAGMGALQRLADDHNPDVAAAASKAINELKQQWNLEEGDGLRFIMNQHQLADDTEDDDDDDDLGDK